MQVNRLSPALGAEITGVDLSAPQTAATIAAIKQAWLDNLVLVFRGQKLTDEDLVRFSRNFGDLDKAPPNEAANTKGNAYVPDLPEVTVISNVVVDGVPIGALGAGESEWHTDMSYMPLPPSASLLYSLEVPSEGGNTGFSNMYAAYETLPDDLRAAIEGRKCIHDSSYTSAGDLRKGAKPVVDVSQAPGARHPLLRTHPETGRTALFLGRRRNAYILGLPVEESEKLLDRIWQHATQPQFTYIHVWRPGDLVMWDNRCTMHRRDAFSPQARRILHRTQVKGDQPYYRPAA